MYVGKKESFYVIAKIGSDTTKKYFDKAMAALGGEAIDGTSVWVINETMYASASDVYDIIASEVARFSSDDKHPCELKEGADKLIISEYRQENTYIK